MDPEQTPAKNPAEREHFRTVSLISAAFGTVLGTVFGLALNNPLQIILGPIIGALIGWLIISLSEGGLRYIVIASLIGAALFSVIAALVIYLFKGQFISGDERLILAWAIVGITLGAVIGAYLESRARAMRGNRDHK